MEIQVRIQKISYLQKQPFRGVFRKRYSENMQQIYRRTPMPKSDFNKVALHIFRVPFPKNTLNGCFYIYRRFLYSISIFKIIKLLVGKKILVGPFCTSHSICYNIRFRQDSFVWTCCAFNHSTFNYKTLVQFYEINIGFLESLIIENVQNLN